jgi:hypothetical protein
MARPRKIKTERMDARTSNDACISPEEWQAVRLWMDEIGVKLSETPPIPESDTDQKLNAIFRQCEINRARVDQFNEEPLAGCFAPLILNRATDAERAFAADLMATALEECTPEQWTAFALRLARLKANAEQPHRNAYAYWGYARFIEENGREPSKPELKAYLLENPKVFPGMPAADAKSQWTDLWRDCRLSKLADRNVRTKP